MGHTVFIAGHGRLPTGAAAKGLMDVLAVTVEIDRKHGVILDADCTLATAQGKEFVRGLLRGYSMDDIPAIIQDVSLSYFGKVRSALIAALKDLGDEYQRQVETIKSL